MKKTTLALILTILLFTKIILFAPIIPATSIETHTRTRPMQFSAQFYNQSDVPIFVNVTNTDSVGGVFSVTLELWEGKPVPWGVEFETKETTTILLFIRAGATEKFISPKEWAVLESTYTFHYAVTPPTTQEQYNITKNEYKSLFSIIANF